MGAGRSSWDGLFSLYTEFDGLRKHFDEKVLVLRPEQISFMHVHLGYPGHTNGSHAAVSNVVGDELTCKAEPGVAWLVHFRNLFYVRKTHKPNHSKVATAYSDAELALLPPHV